MHIRFGYVSIALSLWEASPSRTMTFKRYQQLSKHDRVERLKAITRSNLENTRRAIHFNIAAGINLYRLSSALVPLATHPEVKWDYLAEFSGTFKEIGRLVKENRLRISFHPGQYTLFTGKRQSVTENAVTDMVHHYRMLDAMGIAGDSVINIHIGGAYGDKESALERFYENIGLLPGHVFRRMTLENDDKTYTAEETLAVCEKLGVPMVFDYHHHMANNGDTPYEDLLPRIFDTWDGTGLKPKIHLSSPKSDKSFRSHHDYVDLAFIRPFLQNARALGRDFDVMIEAKQKDLALLKLMDEMERVRGWKRIGGAEFVL